MPSSLEHGTRQEPATVDPARAKAGFVESGQGGEDLRPEIAVSWWRSQLSGVKPEIPVEAMTSAEILDADERLRRSVQPILDELATNLAGTNSAIVLADHRPVIIDRRGTTRAIEAEMDRLAVLPGYALGEAFVGTNAIGTAAEERRLVRVAGAEHYAEIFKHLSCYGVPLVHPLTRRLVGVLDLTFPPSEEHPLMPFYMREAGKRIESILAEWASLRERAQFECFLTLGRRARRAVLSTMDDAVLLNRSARDLDPVDQAALLRAAADLGEADHGAVVDVMLGHEEPVSIRVHTQSDQARFAGVVLEVVPTRSRRSTGGRAPVGLPGLVGDSAAWTTFCAVVEQTTGADVPLLLTGEAGTGKLAAAQALHARSARPRVAVFDVASIMADGQAQWLQALGQALDDGESTVVARHLQLCDEGLAAAVAAEIDRAQAPGGRLIGTLTTGQAEAGLQPLLDRFCLRLEVPPLRDRRDDVEALVRCFVNRHAAGGSLRFHPETLAALRSFDFPGDVRELERVVAGLAATRRGDILPADLPALHRTGPSHLTAMERAEREAIVKAMRESNGNKAAAAALLGISRPTLYRKLVVYGIEPA
jgi:transcriptional regulator of acetoin/glycerol metabolism